MRTAGEQILASYSNLISLPGSAETIGLANASIDLITAGMALQWFDIPLARVEFQCIPTPGGWVALRRDGPRSSLDLRGFFGGSYPRATFPVRQSLDWEGLCGRILSTAHAPQPGDSASLSMFARLRNIYNRFQNDEQAVIDYETELYYGHFP